MRKPTSMMGAIMPIAHSSGSTPTRKVDRPMITMVIEEGVFAPDEIAERAEDESAERADEEAGRRRRAARQSLAVSFRPAKNWAPMMAASEP